MGKRRVVTRSKVPESLIGALCCPGVILFTVRARVPFQRRRAVAGRNRQRRAFKLQTFAPTTLSPVPCPRRPVRRRS